MRDTAVVPSEIVPGLRMALGDIDMALCSLSARKCGVQASHWHDPANADLSVRWDGSVLAAPPVGRLDEFLTKLLSECDSGRSVRVALLAPVDLTHPLFDRVLDAERLRLAVFERDRRATRGRGAVSPMGNPRTALYLFDIPNPTTELVAAFEPWGHALLPRGGFLTDGPRSKPSRST